MTQDVRCRNVRQGRDQGEEFGDVRSTVITCTSGSLSPSLPIEGLFLTLQQG